MDGCLLSLWNSFINKRREKQKLRENISYIYHDLLKDKNDEETWMLAFSLALEILPEHILNYCIPLRDFGYVDYYEYWFNKNLTVRDVLQLGLKHKDIEPIRKHTYSFIWGTKLTIDRVLSKIIVK